MAAGIRGIHSVSYVADDVALGVRFFEDWGLALASRTDGQAALATALGSEVWIRSREAATAAAFDGRPAEPGFGGVVWAVEAAADIDDLAARFAAGCHPHSRTADRLLTRDPFGYDVEFRVALLKDPGRDAVSRYNTPGDRARVSSETPQRARAVPARIGHVVFDVAGPASLEVASRFYADTLGFQISDLYTRQAAFLRCAPEQDHHNVALLDIGKGRDGFQHVAFETHDIHEVFSGGLQFAEKGWDTSVGPGRHKASSAYFWYFHNPLGGEVEYFSDMDFLDGSWIPRETPPSPASLAEWALASGVKRFSSMRELKAAGGAQAQGGGKIN